MFKNNLMRVFSFLIVILLIDLTLEFPIIHTPELGDNIFNFYVSEYNGQSTNTDDFNIRYDIPIENQVIWPTTINFNTKKLKKNMTISLMWVAVIPEDFNITINHTYFTSDEIEKLQGNKLNSKVLVEFFNFKIQTKDDIDKLEELFEDFDFDKLKNIKFKRNFDSIIKNLPLFNKEVIKVPDQSEQNNLLENKFFELYNALEDWKHMLFVVPKSLAPKSNMDKLEDFPNLLSTLYDFDATKPINLSNFPKRTFMDYTYEYIQMKDEENGDSFSSRVFITFSLQLALDYEEVMDRIIGVNYFDRDYTLNHLYEHEEMERRMILI